MKDNDVVTVRYPKGAELFQLAHKWKERGIFVEVHATDNSITITDYQGSGLLRKFFTMNVIKCLKTIDKRDGLQIEASWWI